MHAYEGTVDERTEDGILALFGAPIALEDAPQRAIRSAQAIHRKMIKVKDFSEFNQLGRRSEEHEHWKMAADTILKTANNISNRELREGFLEAKPIRRILSKATV